MARRMDAELYAVTVDIIGDKPDVARDEKSLAANLQFAEKLGREKTSRLKGRSVAVAAARFVREKHAVTIQMIFGRTRG